MKPRGERLVCSLRTIDGCVGAYSVFPGEAPRSISRIEPVVWDREPTKEVMQGSFSVIGEMGMTGSILLVNTYQWRALKQAKLENFFYAAVLWGGNPLKVVEDAELMAKRAT